METLISIRLLMRRWMSAISRVSRNWTAWDGVSDITAETGKTITVVECDAEYLALKAGSKVVTAKADE